MAVLVFITVLIVLLLILTVMVHMRNRKLKSTLEEQMAERRLLDKICADFTAVYYVELNTGFFEILHMNDGTNAKKMNLKQCDNFNYAADQYAVQYLHEKERQEFKDWISTGHLKEQLSRKERITYHYRSKPNPNQHEFFEAQAVKIYEDETRLSNEIISAIAKSYCSIYRIDVQKDFFEEDLNFAAEAAKREAEMKTRFLATMSHDIRTPLNGIIGMVNMGNQYADDPQMQQKIREKVMESLKYLVSLVNDVLDMNKLQSGDLKDQQLLFDLTMALRELNQIYDEWAAKKGIRYETDWKSTYSHSALVGNPVYLGRILSNIMDNAIKFSQAGSVITVWVEEETLDDGRAIFTFYCKDQGVGMSEDFIAHAFDMFSQESQTSRSRYEGTGLGLAITKQLVDRMDGRIELKSKAGVGTTVIVKIPFKIGTQDKNSNLSDKPVSLDDYSVEGMRALVV